MTTKVYHYPACSTCKQALVFLNKNKLSFELLNIVESPPSRRELEQMARFLEKDGGTFKNLFNTSGVLYRELKVADQLKAGLTKDAALDLLSKNGKLIKRPFVLDSEFGVVGFKVDAWEKFAKFGRSR